jgi:DnaK suppressor protein
VSDTDGLGIDDLHTVVGAGALEALQAEVADIERALARLDDGTYGTCEVCRERLPDPVLRERPAARYCSAHLPMALG